MGWLPGGSPAPMTMLICACALTAGIGVLMIYRRS